MICGFIMDNIISHFGLPSTLVSDNGMPFKNKEVKQFLKKFHIQHHFSTPYYSQSKGQVEASNKTIEQILHKTITKHGRDRHIQLVYGLWAYCMNVCMTTMIASYNLVYGVDVIMPLELEIPSLRVPLKGVIDDDSYRSLHLNQLELLDECHLNSLQHLQAYQKSLSR